MKCQNCGFDNPKKNKFCKNCGTTLLKVEGKLGNLTPETNKKNKFKASYVFIVLLVYIILTVAIILFVYIRTSR